MKIQAGFTEGYVCSLTQEMRAAWAAGDLFQAPPLGDCWVPGLGGWGVEREKEAGAGDLSIDPCLSTYTLLFAQRNQLRVELCGWCSQNGAPRARGPKIWVGGELGPGQADWGWTKRTL